MTAEFAAVVPAVVLVLALCLAAVNVATLQLRLQDAVAIVARSAARGGAIAIDSLVAGASVSVTRGPALICATATVPSPLMGGLFGTIQLSARSCAAAAGH